MSTDPFNPAQTVNVPSQGVSHPLFRNLGAARGWTSPVLSDNETYSLGSPTDGDSDPSGLYLVYNPDAPTDAALYAITTSRGAVSELSLLYAYAGSTFSSDGTTDDRLHLYD